MRLDIRYVSEFRYPDPVRESHNALRACPADLPHQRLQSFELRTDPPARVYTYTDYWGTRVDTFGVRSQHRHLTVAARSVVESDGPPQPDGPVPIAALDDTVRDESWELLQPSAHTDWDGGIAAAARDIAAGCDDLTALIRAVSSAVNDWIEYAPGATYVGVDVNEVFAVRKGVCQDFAHLALAMYRSLGLPARYVSGYFYAADQSVGEEPEDAEIEVQTHAWVEAAVPGHGWWALDPTNRQLAGPRHVKIGHGRDYDDVMPLRGVFHGPTDHELGVNVRISRDQLSAFDHRRVEHQQQQ